MGMIPLNRGQVRSLVHQAAPVSVKAYGATGDGVTDDAAAIQAAIDARQDRSAVVYFPPGTYKCSTSIIVGNATHLIGAHGLMTSQVVGEDTMIYRPPAVLDFSGQPCHGIVSPDENISYRAHGMTIEHLTIKGSSRDNARSGILLRTNTQGTSVIKKVGLATVSHCFVEQFQTGVNFNSQADSSRCLYTHVHNCNLGFVGGSSEDCVIGSIFWQIYSSPVMAISGDSGFYAFNEVEPTLVVTGIFVEGDRNKIIGNDIKQCGAGISCRGTGNVISGNTLHTDVAGYGIILGTSDGATDAIGNSVIGNTITSFGTSGAIAAIKVWGDSRENAIHANTIRTARVASPEGITLTATAGGDPANNSIMGNTVASDVTTPFTDAGSTNRWLGNVPAASEPGA